MVVARYPAYIPPIKAFRMRENAKLPVRANSTDAGLDFYYAPDLTQEPGFWWQDCEYNVHIFPQTTVSIPTGIKVEIPSGCMLMFKDKSGIAGKQNLHVGGGVIDEAYHGELIVMLYNTGKEKQTIKPYQKVTQGIIVPVYYSDVVEVTNENELNKNSTRGTGGFGSTGL
jgi:dUTP pyrophosphatase